MHATKLFSLRFLPAPQHKAQSHTFIWATLQGLICNLDHTSWNSFHPNLGVDSVDFPTCHLDLHVRNRHSQAVINPTNWRYLHQNEVNRAWKFLFVSPQTVKKKAQSRLDLNCWQDVYEEKPEGQVKISVRTERQTYWKTEVDLWVIRTDGVFVDEVPRKMERGKRNHVQSPVTVPQAVSGESRRILRMAPSRWLERWE